MRIETNVLVRITVLVILLVNQALLVLEINPIPYSNEEIFEGVSVVAVVLQTLWATWKNTPITDAAQRADTLMKIEKNKRKEVK